MVPGSTLRYGSIFSEATESPRATRMRPSDAAVMPFPSEEVTPPVTNTNFGTGADLGGVSNDGRAVLAPGEGAPECEAPSAQREQGYPAGSAGQRECNTTNRGRSVPPVGGNSGTSTGSSMRQSSSRASKRRALNRASTITLRSTASWSTIATSFGRSQTMPGRSGNGPRNGDPSVRNARVATSTHSPRKGGTYASPAKVSAPLSFIQPQRSARAPRCSSSTSPPMTTSARGDTRHLSQSALRVPGT